MRLRPAWVIRESVAQMHMGRNADDHPPQGFKVQRPNIRAARAQQAPHRWAPRQIHKKHTKAIEYVEKLERDIWQSSFKIALVRDPWAQMLSSYFWWLQRALKVLPAERRWQADAVQRLGSFDAFLQSEYGSKQLSEWPGNPEDWFLDRQGKDLVDHIAKLEDPVPLFERIGQVSRLPNALQLDQRNVTDHAHYSTYYTDEGIEHVAQRFDYVIRRFGYTFEDQRVASDRSQPR